MLLNLFLCNNEVYMERYYIRGTIRSRRLGLYNYLSLHICPLWGYAWLDMTYASKIQNWPAGPWPDRSFWQWNTLFPRVLDEKRFPSCILFRIWLIWLDSFDKKWNSPYEGNGLPGQFWQMESALNLSVSWWGKTFKWSTSIVSHNPYAEVTKSTVSS